MKGYIREIKYLRYRLRRAEESADKSRDNSAEESANKVVMESGEREDGGKDEKSGKASGKAG